LPVTAGISSNDLILEGCRIVSEQGTTGRCKWYQKRVESEMLTRTWLGR